MTLPRTILVVDDDPSILEVLCARLSASGFLVIPAGDPFSVMKILKEKSVDLVISDMKMPEMSGMELFTEIRKVYTHLPVIFLTAYGTIPGAVKAVKAGAVDYISKPFDGKSLVTKINELLAESAAASVRMDPPTDDGFYWGKSSVMKDLYLKTIKVAASNANVLILGESGVGKEGIATTLHNHSSRADKPYVIVDCGSTPPGILESELFGHLKGSFTNATQDKQGLIEAAEGGTLFLDEIGNISPEMQSRLLRFLEEKRIRRVGAIKETAVDCRVISATNADIVADIEDGKFRQDLYYRLRVVTLNVPPLRDRKGDVPELAHLFVERHRREQNLPEIDIPKETLQWMEEYHWPGNVRELKNAMEAGVVLCRNNRILVEDMQVGDLRDSEDEDLSDSGFSIKSNEREAIIRALREANGVQKHAADLLDISRRSIYYKIKKYNIQVTDYK